MHRRLRVGVQLADLLAFIVFYNKEFLLSLGRPFADNFGMQGIGQRLRDRARELGLADTTVAERLGLSQQRYFNYISDQTEPDFETLLRICRALDTTPSTILGHDVFHPEPDDAAMLRARISAAAGVMSVPILRITAAIVDTLVEFHGVDARLPPAKKNKNRP